MSESICAAFLASSWLKFLRSITDEATKLALRLDISDIRDWLSSFAEMALASVNTAAKSPELRAASILLRASFCSGDTRVDLLVTDRSASLGFSLMKEPSNDWSSPSRFEVAKAVPAAPAAPVNAIPV